MDSPLKQTRLSAQLPSLATLASEAPYRLPAHLDFEALEYIISAKRDATEDHVWALREDPGYFKEHLGDYYEHRQEQVPNSYGKPCNIDKASIWDTACYELMMESYRDFTWWDMISKDFDKLCALREKHSASISPDKELPQEFLLALLAFRGLIFTVSQDLRGRLEGSITVSPPLRSHFIRTSGNKPGKGDKVMVQNKTPVDKDEDKDQR